MREKVYAKVEREKREKRESATLAKVAISFRAKKNRFCARAKK